MTIAHAVIIAFIVFIVFTVLQLLDITNLLQFGYTICSWIGLITLSSFIAFLFNKQSGVVQFLIFIIMTLSFLTLYATLASLFPNGILYFNALGVGVFESLVACVTYMILFPTKSSNKMSNETDIEHPRLLIEAIYREQYVSRDDLFRFYTNYVSNKNSFIDLLNTICNVCLSSMNNENSKTYVREKCQKVYHIVKPILDEEKDVEYLTNISGKERDSLLYLHKLITNLGSSNNQSNIHHLSLIANSIISNQVKIEHENKRNSQSLTISIVGILITIILSLLSFLMADKYSALHMYMDYIM